MSSIRLKQEGFKYVDKFHSLEQAESRAATYRDMGFDVRICGSKTKLDYIWYSLYIK